MERGIPPREELERSTRVVLYRLAQEHGIRGRSVMRKAELVDALAALSPQGGIDAPGVAPESEPAGPSLPDLVIESAPPPEELPDETPLSDFAEAVSTEPTRDLFIEIEPLAAESPEPTPTRLKRRTTFETVTIGSLYAKDGSRLPLPGAWALALVMAYIVLNRAISDRFVLPIGASIRLYEVVLILVGLGWVVWMAFEPHPMPFGLPAISGLALVVLVGIAPFLHGPTLDSYQTNGAERGLFRMVIFVALFLASYHIAFRLRHGLALLGFVVATTAVQSGFAIYERVTEKPIEFLDSLASSLGLVADPLSVRPDEVGGVFTRLSGDVRAVATAPHPIVLSSVIAIGILIAGVWLLYARRTRTKVVLAAAASVMVIGLPMANSRTGFVILMVLAPPLLLLAIDKAPTLILWSLPLIAAMGFAFSLSPDTPRLLLNSLTDPTADQNTVVRLERFERIPELLDERPFLGAGYLTHDPQIQYFDNAYNLALIELGIIGLALLVTFFVVSLIRAWSATGRSTDREAILPIAGVIGSMALLAGGATFDAWTFDQFFPTCLILIGLGLGRSAVVMRRDLTESTAVVRREEVAV